jgi:tetratricopeptide (TPR) repeat protein
LRDDESLFTHSLDVAPNGLLALHNLGNVRMHQGRNGEAIALYRRAVAIEPRHFESLGAMAPLLAKEGKIEESNQAFEEFLKQEAALPDALRPKPYAMHVYTFASTMLKQKNREKAIEYFQKLLAIYPDDQDSIRGLKDAMALPSHPSSAPTQP